MLLRMMQMLMQTCRMLPVILHVQMLVLLLLALLPSLRQLMLVMLVMHMLLFPVPVLIINVL